MRALSTSKHWCISLGSARPGIEARPEACARHVEASVGVVTALVPLIGYERAAEMAKEALATGRTVRELARAALGMSDAELDLVLNPTVLATHAEVSARRTDPAGSARISAT